MSFSPVLFGSLGFGAAFLSFAGVLILVLCSHPGTRQAYLLIAALLLSIFWSGSMSYAFWTASAELVWMPLNDALHVSVWLAFVCGLLMTTGQGPSAQQLLQGLRQTRGRRFAIAVPHARA